MMMDFLYPNHIENLLEAVQEESVAYCDALKRKEKVDNDQCLLVTKELVASEEHSLKRMLEGNFIPINCLIFKTNILREDYLDEELNVLEDWDLLIRLSNKFNFKHLAKIRAEYSIRSNSQGVSDNTTGNNLEVWRQTAKLIEKRYRSLWRAEGLQGIPTK